MKTTVILVRHGITPWNIQERFQGMSDIPLTDMGRKQAAYAKKALQNTDIDAAYVSPLIRAFETCKIILEGHNIEPIIADNLHELNAGNWEGYNSAQIEELFPGQLKIWNSTPTKVFMEDGETLMDAQKRAMKVFQKVNEKHPGKTILLVSHMVCLSMILLTVAGLNLDEIWNHPISNAAISVIEVDTKTGKAEIKKWNDTNHIPKELIRTPMFKDRK